MLEDYICMHLMLHLVIYVLLVCFVVFALVLFLMPNVVCVSGLPIFLYRLLGTFSLIA